MSQNISRTMNIKTMFMKQSELNIKAHNSNIMSRLEHDIDTMQNTTMSDMSLYDMTISETHRIMKDIMKTKIADISKKSSRDGRLDSANKEAEILTPLKDGLLNAYPTWDIKITKARACCDIIINGIWIDLKIVDVGASNSGNKKSIYRSITALDDYKEASTWNEFLERLVNDKKYGKFKTIRDKTTEYHYLVISKKTGDVILKSIFDVHTFKSNPSNDLQINWNNEFQHRDYMTPDNQYMSKVHELLSTLQKSVRDDIERNQKFPNTDLKGLLGI